MASQRNDAVQLDDEREHLLASISDLDAEHEAGEISDQDYAALRGDYVARAAAAIRAGDTGPATPGAATGTATGTAKPRVDVRRWLGRRSTRRWMGVVLAISFVGIATLLALALAGVRLPGEGVSGGVTLNQAQQIRRDLDQAQALGAAGNVSDALNLYDEVLKADPRQPEALAYRGYLLCITAEATKSTALVTVGRDSIEEAIAADPGYGDAYFFDALVLLRDYGKRQESATTFKAAFAHHVSPDLVVAERATIRQLFESLHEPVPAAVG